MKSLFTQTAETLEQRKARLEKQAKALSDSLQKPNNPQPRLTPDGKLRRDGQDIARKATEHQRVDIDKQLETLREQLQEKEKSREMERERSVTKSRSM